MEKAARRGEAGSATISRLIRDYLAQRSDPLMRAGEFGTVPPFSSCELKSVGPAASSVRRAKEKGEFHAAKE